ncbi:MAG: hypothetical protein ACYDDA_05285 [Acidiferrobacteraceae bacterium]
MATDRAQKLALAQKLFVRAGCPTEAGDKEAASAYRKYVKLAVEHGFKIDEVCAGITAAGANAKAWSIEDFMRAADRGKELIALAKMGLADPEVQKTVSAVRDIGSGIMKAAAAMRARRRS